MNKTQKVTVTLQVVVPTGTSKTKVEKTIKSLLKVNTPETFKIGIPHAAIIEPAPRKVRVRKKSVDAFKIGQVVEAAVKETSDQS